MAFVAEFLDLLLHLDQHILWLVQNYGIWAYLILFLIILFETGLVVTPFLPGDSLLFAVGALAAAGSLKLSILFLLLAIAAISGNSLNYFIGYWLGPHIVKKDHVKYIRKEYLERTHKFFEKYGGKTIIITRFIPILRTFAPFLAGLGSMTFWRFTIYNIIGGLAWVSLFLFGGYFFGNIPYVKDNFTIVIGVIVVMSLIPVVIEILKYRKQRSASE